MNSAGPETIAVAKGPTGLREAVMEWLGEQADMSVLSNQQVSPPATTVAGHIYEDLGQTFFD